MRSLVPMWTTPENLPELALLILGYGTTCLGFGMVFGYVAGPSIIQGFLSLFSPSARRGRDASTGCIVSTLGHVLRASGFLRLGRKIIDQDERLEGSQDDCPA